MFKVIAIVMSFVVVLAFPPAAFIVLPALIIYLDHMARKAKELKRQRSVFLEYQAEQERLKRFRNFGR